MTGADLHFKPLQVPEQGSHGAPGRPALLAEAVQPVQAEGCEVLQGGPLAGQEHMRLLVRHPDAERPQTCTSKQAALVTWGAATDNRRPRI